MLDGTLSVRYGADKTIRRIENGLVRYTYFKNVPVISSKEAYELLCSGQFNDTGSFGYRSPKEVIVRAWVRDYMIDTKGFYQPVYLFDVVSKDGKYKDRIMIPAMQ